MYCSTLSILIPTNYSNIAKQLHKTVVFMKKEKDQIPIPLGRGLPILVGAL